MNRKDARAARRSPRGGLNTGHRHCERAAQPEVEGQVGGYVVVPNSAGLQESVGYVLKRLLLGKPLINDQLKHERLGNPIALGVLSSDAMSSAAYGTEEILIELLPWAGLA